MYVGGTEEIKTKKNREKKRKKRKRRKRRESSGGDGMGRGSGTQWVNGQGTEQTSSDWTELELNE